MAASTSAKRRGAPRKQRASTSPLPMEQELAEGPGSVVGGVEGSVVGGGIGASVVGGVLTGGWVGELEPEHAAARSAATNAMGRKRLHEHAFITPPGTRAHPSPAVADA